MRQLRELLFALLATLRDMLPILITIGVFEVLVLGRMPTDPAMLVLGMLAMLIGLTFMVRGLEIWCAGWR